MKFYDKRSLQKAKKYVICSADFILIPDCMGVKIMIILVVLTNLVVHKNLTSKLNSSQKKIFSPLA